jgi:DNA-binding transcriptional ArsR family regulator
VYQEEKPRLNMMTAVFKAMANPVRLYLVEQLAERDMCVCELTELVKMDISTVSRHLTALKQAGILSDERKGAQVIYHLRCRCVLSFFSCVTDVLQKNRDEAISILQPKPREA